MAVQSGPIQDGQADGERAPPAGIAALAGEIGAARALVDHDPARLTDVLARILVGLAAGPQLDRTDPATIAVLDEAQLLLDGLNTARAGLSGELAALDHRRRAGRAYRRPEQR